MTACAPFAARFEKEVPAERRLSATEQQAVRDFVRTEIVGDLHAKAELLGGGQR